MRISRAGGGQRIYLVGGAQQEVHLASGIHLDRSTQLPE